MRDGEVELINLNAAKFGKKAEFDIQVTLDDGRTEEYRLTRRDMDTFYDIYEEYPEIDIPDPTGSAGAIAASVA
jgi:hypothetical protein